ncbi:MAG TPA: GNAT family N-acetyltransferase [Casimicrobiaceae bacterium]|nr:GNAT family N-acetyltransferase [Casimicrobiaceae bacterium]
MLLRWFAPGDAPRVQALAADAAVAATTATIPHPYPDGAAAAWIAGQSAARDRGVEFVYAICSVDGATLLGAIALRPTAGDGPGRENIGYWIGRAYWGHGYATAATMAIVALAFGYLDCETLTASHLERNAASARVLEKCGFVPLRTGMREHRGRPQPLVVRAITRDAWELSIGGVAGAGMPGEERS